MSLSEICTFMYVYTQHRSRTKLTESATTIKLAAHVTLYAASNTLSSHVPQAPRNLGRMHTVRVVTLMLSVRMLGRAAAKTKTRSGNRMVVLCWDSDEPPTSPLSWLRA